MLVSQLTSLFMVVEDACQSPMDWVCNVVNLQQLSLEYDHDGDDGIVISNCLTA